METFQDFSFFWIIAAKSFGAEFLSKSYLFRLIHNNAMQEWKSEWNVSAKTIIFVSFSLLIQMNIIWEKLETNHFYRNFFSFIEKLSSIF